MHFDILETGKSLKQIIMCFTLHNYMIRTFPVSDMLKLYHCTRIWPKINFKTQPMQVASTRKQVLEWDPQVRYTLNRKSLEVFTGFFPVSPFFPWSPFFRGSPFYHLWFGSGIKGRANGWIGVLRGQLTFFAGWALRKLQEFAPAALLGEQVKLLIIW